MLKNIAYTKKSKRKCYTFMEIVDVVRAASDVRATSADDYTQRQLTLLTIIQNTAQISVVDSAQGCLNLKDAGFSPAGGEYFDFSSKITIY